MKKQKKFYQEKNFWYGYLISLLQIPGLVFISYFFVYKILDILIRLNNTLMNMELEISDNITAVAEQVNIYEGIIHSEVNTIIFLLVIFIFLAIAIYSISKTFSVYFFRKHLDIKQKNKEYIKHSFLVDFAVGLIFSILLLILLMVMFSLIMEGGLLSPVVWIVFFVIGMFLLLFMELFSQEAHEQNPKKAFKTLFLKMRKSWKSLIFYALNFFIVLLLKLTLIIGFLMLFNFNVGLTLLLSAIIAVIVSFMLTYARIKVGRNFHKTKV